jgi:hypothetical protein
MSHRNSNENMDPHHLYEIVDTTDNDIFKYGVSWETIDKDGLSSRARSQIAYLNRLYEWVRFFGRILITDIAGKKAAKEIESKFIKDYELKHGRKPKGNVRG